MGISQEKAAEALDISPNFYGKVERGVHALSYEDLKKVKELYKVSIDYLLTGEVMELDQSEIAEIINFSPIEARGFLEDILKFSVRLYNTGVEAGKQNNEDF
jgi:transcriptional regulator with XRE-family HTH domain